MKNNLVITLFVLFTIQYVNTQAQTIKSSLCNSYGLPDSTRLLQTLSFKPVFGIDTKRYCLCCNVTDTIKKRLLYLLIPGWTESEIQDYIKRRLTNSFYKVAIYDDAKKFAKGNDSIYKKAIDSLINYYGKSERKLIMDRHFNDVDGSILRTVAFLNMKEAIPVIKKYFNYYNKENAELCLARFGDTDLQKKIIESCVPNNALNAENWYSDFYFNKFRKLTFINTQESIYALNQFIDSTHQFMATGDDLGWTVDKIIADIRRVIVNDDFQALVKDVYESGFHKYSGEFIMQVKNWIINNKGRYIINQEFCAY